MTQYGQLRNGHIASSTEWDQTPYITTHTLLHIPLKSMRLTHILPAKWTARVFCMCE